MVEKPKVFRAIVTAVLSLIVFFLAYTLSFLVLGLVVNLLISIPILGKIISIFFYLRGDSPEMMLCILCTIACCLLIRFLQGKLNKHEKTQALSTIILASIILAVQVPSLIINIIAGEWVFVNIIHIIASIWLIIRPV